MVVFEPAARSILILEDDNLILRVLVELARRVGRNLRKEGLPVDLTILSAQTLDQAYQILEEYDKHIDILSVDVNLNHDVESKKTVTSMDTPIGGFGLLEKYKDDPQTLTIVYSGETQPLYAKKAFQTYNALNYIFKREPDADDQFSHTIEAGLWYLTTSEALSLPLDQLERRDLERAEVAWAKTAEVAENAGIYIKDFPEALDEKIKEYRIQYIHPDTDLPVDDWTQAKLRRYLVNTPEWIEHEPPIEPELKEWTVIRCRLKGYGHFTNQFASQKQALMHIFGRSVTNSTQDYIENLIFTGQIDREFMQGDPFIIMILNTVSPRIVAGISDAIDANFNQASVTVFPGEQIHNLDPADYPLVLEYKTWTSDENHDFSDLHAVIDELSRGDDE